MVSSRLMSLSLLVNNCEKIIDIGCDHGLLDIYLTLNKGCKCSCCDVSKHIVDRAISNISKYDLNDRINVFIGNGFNDLKLDNDVIMILAGMGTSTILKILEKNKTNSIICQTNTDLYILRKKVCDMGYYISSENLVYDNGRYYVSIRFIKGICEYSYDEYLLGPCLIRENSKLFNDYIHSLYNKNINGYCKSLEFDSCSNDLKMFMECLKKYI